MSTLYEIADDLARLEAMLAAAGGDVTDCESEVDEWFSHLMEDRNRKINGYASLIIEIEARASTREKEADRLADRARIDRNKATWLKDRLKRYFEVSEIRALDTDRFHVVLATNGGKQPVVVNVEPELLPDVFRRVKTEVNTEAIRSHLEAIGPLTSPDGVVLAQFGERGRSIRIR